ncbi:MAG: exodeoxyribonuclease VII small subunit [Ruminococcaceae bacterium]|nr:exodeoxyribonuclease VII small subunit [Oscillospiraceae bacterium]
MRKSSSQPRKLKGLFKNMEMYTLDTAMIRLKEIAEELESGEHDLEMSMKLYEEGVRIITFCNKALSNAKQKVTELSQYDDEEDENEEGVQL